MRDPLDHVGDVGVADDIVVHLFEGIGDPLNHADDALKDIKQLAGQPPRDPVHHLLDEGGNLGR